MHPCGSRAPGAESGFRSACIKADKPLFSKSDLAFLPSKNSVAKQTCERRKRVLVSDKELLYGGVSTVETATGLR
jgi:hypothetical protein